MVQQDRQEPTGYDPKARPAATRRRTVCDSKESISGSNAQSPGKRTSFRLTLTGLRRDLDQDSDDECISPVSARSQSGTRLESSAPPVPAVQTEPQRKSYLEPDNSILIPRRSSLDIRISFTADSEPSPEEQPHSPPSTPWLTFLDSEIEATTSSGEYYTHRMLVILKKYFSSPSPTQEDARRTADRLDKANDDFLLGVGSWAFFDDEEDMQAFLWLLWGALLEIAILMDYRTDSQESVVMLVEELLRGREKEIEVPGKHGQKWKGLEVPGFHSIWPTAYVGFGRLVTPLESSQKDWITCYSFLGRLTGAGLVDSWDLEVWALDDALGEETWQYTLQSPGLECTVLAAAEYVKHAGERLAVTGAETRGWVRSLSLEKWSVWMDRFAVTADLMDDGPAKWAAQSAHDFMLAIAVKVGFVAEAGISKGRLGAQAAENWI